MERKGSIFGKLFGQIKDRFGSKKSERSGQPEFKILDGIISPNSSAEEFEEIYNQLEYKGTLTDIINEVKKHTIEPLEMGYTAATEGILSKEGLYLTIGAEHKDGEIYVGQVCGFFKVETGAEAIATLVRRSEGTVPVMFMIAPGPEADEYSFRFGYR